MVDGGRGTVMGLIPHTDPAARLFRLAAAAGDEARSRLQAGPGKTRGAHRSRPTATRAYR